MESPDAVDRLAQQLLALPQAQRDPIAHTLAPILVRPTHLSSSGYPYFSKPAWDSLRDHLPHLFGLGLRIYGLLEEVEAHAGELAAPDERIDNLRRACQVVRQVVLTSAITAPPDLWLMRHLLGTFAQLGLLDRLLEGDALYPDSCFADAAGRRQLAPEELEHDLQFLLSRGLVEQYEDSYRIAGHPRVRQLLESVDQLPAAWSEGRSRLWRRLFAGEVLAGRQLEDLLSQSVFVHPRSDVRQNHWIPTVEELELGYRLLPIVLGLRASERTAPLERGHEVAPTDWSAAHPLCAAGALEVLTSAGWMERCGEHYRVTAVGERGFERGPGPFGIIETYHPYMINGVKILLEGRRGVWVRRGDNLGASQDANRATFAKANDALDRFCQATGFSYRVFIEHAIGRGEASRQRFERSGDEGLQYFGADLEEAAIAAARREQAAGRLPQEMVFVQADIGRPEVLLAALRQHGAEPQGAVMLVGNGFHEVRGQTDEKMVEVFRGYQQAGVVLLFTEENALSIDDLRATAWNTFHAGFKYVHEKSGQGLRPARSRPPVRLGSPLRAAWSECARQAGYVRADDFCTRTRTIYPYPPASGHNPAISVNHFFVPAELARRLGVG